MTTRRRGAIFAIFIVLGLGGVAAYWFAAPIRAWIRPSADAEALVVSGNIEAHESVVSFKTVQSRIVELPFDEGQWVKTGTVLARLDLSDYAQQVTIASAALTVQQRQLAVAKENVEVAKKTIVSDEADLELKQLEFDRAQDLWSKRRRDDGDARSSERRPQAVDRGARSRQGARGDRGSQCVAG